MLKLPLIGAQAEQISRVKGANMEAQIKLGRIFGVEIGLHYSWLIDAPP